jgi:RecB family endonuclease NucS
MGYSNGKTNRIVAVEVKSHLRAEHLDEFVEMLEKIPKFFPEHKGKEVIGILAAVDIPADMPKRVAKAGIHLARISEDNFRLVDPRGFRAKSFAA